MVALLLISGTAVNLPARSFTPLHAACTKGHTKVVAMLLTCGAAVNQAANRGTMPLHLACYEGHTKVVALLITNCAAVNQPTTDGFTPLHAACTNEGHSEVVSLLLTNGAAENQTSMNGGTALTEACLEGNFSCVQLLSSYGANRTFTLQLHPDMLEQTAEETAEHFGHDELVAWLTTSRLWSTPLHHLTIIDAARARELLRGGADLHAAAVADGPTPLSLAHALDTAGNAAEGTAAHLVLSAAGPWSEQTHELFPVDERARAVELLLLGHRISREERFCGQEMALFDAWMHHVMPHAVRGTVVAMILYRLPRDTHGTSLRLSVTQCVRCGVTCVCVLLEA